MYFLVPAVRESQAWEVGVRTAAVFSTRTVVRTAVPVEVTVVTAVTAVTAVTVTGGAVDGRAADLTAGTSSVASRPTSAAADIAIARPTAITRVTGRGTGVPGVADRFRS